MLGNIPHTTLTLNLGMTKIIF